MLHLIIGLCVFFEPLAMGQKCITVYVSSQWPLIRLDIYARHSPHDRALDMGPHSNRAVRCRQSAIAMYRVTLNINRTREQHWKCKRVDKGAFSVRTAVLQVTLSDKDSLLFVTNIPQFMKIVVFPCWSADIWLFYVRSKYSPMPQVHQRFS